MSGLEWTDEDGTVVAAAGGHEGGCGGRGGRTVVTVDGRGCPVDGDVQSACVRLVHAKAQH